MTSTETTAIVDGTRGGTALLTVDAVSKRYGKTQALSTVSVELGEGEILGLVGHNGAGKSTLVRLLAGREASDTGAIRVAGLPEGAAFTAAAAERAGIRMVYQELALCPDLTVAENAALSDRRPTGALWRRRAER
ncbi:ATP-binding cassette domain-containing protein, partial [Mycetocola reblochoni]